MLRTCIHQKIYQKIKKNGTASEIFSEIKKRKYRKDQVKKLESLLQRTTQENFTKIEHYYGRIQEILKRL